MNNVILNLNRCSTIFIYFFNPLLALAFAKESNPMPRIGEDSSGIPYPFKRVGLRVVPLIDSFAYNVEVLFGVLDFEFGFP